MADAANYPSPISSSPSNTSISFCLLLIQTQKIFRIIQIGVAMVGQRAYVKIPLKQEFNAEFWIASPTPMTLPLSWVDLTWHTAWLAMKTRTKGFVTAAKGFVRLPKNFMHFRVTYRRYITYKCIQKPVTAFTSNILRNVIRFVSFWHWKY